MLLRGLHDLHRLTRQVAVDGFMRLFELRVDTRRAHLGLGMGRSLFESRLYALDRRNGFSFQFAASLVADAVLVG